MDSLINRAKELLSSTTVNVVVGYGKGTVESRTRALFITKADDAGNLIYNEHCVQNLAVYLTKNELLHHYKKIGVVANKYTLRAILQIASEEQVKEENLVVLAVDENGSMTELTDFSAMEDFVASMDHEIGQNEKEIIAKIDAMTIAERWDFWEQELSKCFKCYACRQACPMCYCNRCMVECNQPQWVHVPAHKLGNLEWHFMRAMHLAGRCVNCGDCARACPMDIPLNLLTYKLIEPIKNDFGAVAGLQAKMESVLSTYKITDKEGFIR
ncbi:MAG: 4Fe-4S dicluster domain-containing protein [Bacteroidales bacterium]